MVAKNKPPTLFKYVGMKAFSILKTSREIRYMDEMCAVESEIPLNVKFDKRKVRMTTYVDINDNPNSTTDEYHTIAREIDNVAASPQTAE